MDYILHKKLDLIADALNAYRIEDVAAVMRRQKVDERDGRIIDIVDYYPPWNSLGTYGVHKVAHEYMDNDWQIARFERFSGLKLAEMPLYGGDTAVRRRFGITHPQEVAVPTPFKLMVKPRPSDDGGTADKTLILDFLVGARPAVAQPAPRQNGGQPRPQQPPPEPERPSDDMFDPHQIALEAQNYQQFVANASKWLVGNGWAACTDEIAGKVIQAISPGFNATSFRGPMLDALGTYRKSRKNGDPHPGALVAAQAVYEDARVGEW